MEDKVIRITYNDQSNMTMVIHSEQFKNEKMMNRQIHAFVVKLGDYQNSNYLMRLNDYFLFEKELGITYLACNSIRMVEVFDKSDWVKTPEEDLMSNLEELTTVEGVNVEKLEKYAEKEEKKEKKSKKKEK